MREPVLVRVDADEILQRAGEANLFVRLELGQVDEHIGVHRRAAEQILVARASMLGVRLRHVVARAVEPAFAGKADELARRVQRNARAAERVAGKLGLGNRHAIHRMPLLRAQVEQRETHAGKLLRAPRDQRVQPAILAQLREGRVRLRRIANRDGAFTHEPFRRPARNRLDHRRVRDDVFPRAGAGRALVVFLDPVGFENHAVAGADEVSRQRQCGEGFANERGDRCGGVIVGHSGKSRHQGIGHGGHEISADAKLTASRAQNFPMIRFVKQVPQSVAAYLLVTLQSHHGRYRAAARRCRWKPDDPSQLNCPERTRAATHPVRRRPPLRLRRARLHCGTGQTHSPFPIARA